MENFWTLLAKSVIIQALIALIVVTAVTYMYVKNMSVPSELLQLLWLVIGFYFGTKVEHGIQSRIRKLKEDRDD